MATIEDVLNQYLAQAELVKKLQTIAFSLAKTKDERFSEWIALMKGPELDAFLKLEPTVKELHQHARKQVAGAFWHQALGQQARALMN